MHTKYLVARGHYPALHTSIATAPPRPPYQLLLPLLARWCNEQAAISFVNDSLLTTVCIQYRPGQVAAAVVYLSYLYMGLPRVDTALLETNASVVAGETNSYLRAAASGRSRHCACVQAQQSRWNMAHEGLQSFFFGSLCCQRSVCVQASDAWMVGSLRLPVCDSPTARTTRKATERFSAWRPQCKRARSAHCVCGCRHFPKGRTAPNETFPSPVAPAAGSFSQISLTHPPCNPRDRLALNLYIHTLPGICDIILSLYDEQGAGHATVVVSDIRDMLKQRMMNNAPKAAGASAAGAASPAPPPPPSTAPSPRPTPSRSSRTTADPASSSSSPPPPLPRMATNLGADNNVSSSSSNGAAAAAAGECGFARRETARPVEDARRHHHHHRDPRNSPSRGGGGGVGKSSVKRKTGESGSDLEARGRERGQGSGGGGGDGAAERKRHKASLA